MNPVNTSQYAAEDRSARRVLTIPWLHTAPIKTFSKTFLAGYHSQGEIGPQSLRILDNTALHIFYAHILWFCSWFVLCRQSISREKTGATCVIVYIVWLCSSVDRGPGWSGSSSATTEWKRWLGWRAARCELDCHSPPRATFDLFSIISIHELKMTMQASL